MTHLLLIRPKIKISIAQPNPPIGLGFIAGILRAHNHKVDILDCAISKEAYSQKFPELYPQILSLLMLK